MRYIILAFLLFLSCGTRSMIMEKKATLNDPCYKIVRVVHFSDGKFKEVFYRDTCLKK